MQARGSVTGLTTAATIFIVTAVGIVVGDSMYGAALITTALTIVVLILLRRLQRALRRSSKLYHYTLKTREPSEVLGHLLTLLEAQGSRFIDLSVRDDGADSRSIKFNTVSTPREHQRLIRMLPDLGTDWHVQIGSGE